MCLLVDTPVPTIPLGFGPFSLSVLSGLGWPKIAVAPNSLLNSGTLPTSVPLKKTAALPDVTLFNLNKLVRSAPASGSVLFIKVRYSACVALTAAAYTIVPLAYTATLAVVRTTRTAITMEVVTSTALSVPVPAPVAAPVAAPITAPIAAPVAVIELLFFPPPTTLHPAFLAGPSVSLVWPATLVFPPGRPQMLNEASSSSE